MIASPRHREYGICNDTGFVMIQGLDPKICWRVKGRIRAYERHYISNPILPSQPPADVTLYCVKDIVESDWNAGSLVLKLLKKSSSLKRIR